MTALVVMGVAGSGKSTVAALLADRLGWAHAEADDFHPAANVALMSTGTPLTDDHRRPWLASIRDWIEACPGDAVVTCSALRRSYRDVLRGPSTDVRFVHLHGTRDQLAARLGARTGHFMPLTLLDSQLATLEVPADDEDALVVRIDGTPAQIVDEIVARLPTTAR